LSWEKVLKSHFKSEVFSSSRKNIVDMEQFKVIKRDYHLLAEKEPDELSVGHTTLLLRAAPRDGPAEDPLDHPRAQGVVVVSCEILPVYEQVVVLVELPELAVDDVEVLVAEEVGHLVNVVLILEQTKCGEEPASPKLRDGDLAGPGPVHLVEYPGYHSVDVS
jgi:hypothetical protein